MYSDGLLGRGSLQHLGALGTRHHFETLLDRADAGQACAVHLGVLLIALGEGVLLATHLGITERFLDFNATSATLSVLLIVQDLHSAGYLELLS